MEDIYLIVGVALLFVVWLWSRKVSKEINEVHKDVQQLLSKVVFMKIETHSDKLFAYNAVNEEFICQGKDMDELNQQFGIRFPDCKGIIVKPDEENVA
jgi:hypothetical protein